MSRRRHTGPPTWDGDNMDIPLGDFAKLWKLTPEEIRSEGSSGRLVASGVPLKKNKRPTASAVTIGGVTYDRVSIKECNAQAWVLHPDLPSTVRAKVEAAGALNRLEQWHRTWINGAIVDVDNDTLILPDGTKIVGVVVSEGPRRDH